MTRDETGEARTSVMFELPYPPSVNHYWRHVGPRVLISRKGREFRARVRATLTKQRAEAFTGPIQVDVTVSPPDRRRRDLDNVLKSLLDALEHGGAYKDDSQISRLTIHRSSVVAGGATIVSIQSMKGQRP